MRRVHQPNGERPGEELAGVRVPGELQVEARLGTGRREAWIVREQQAQIGRAAGDRRACVGPRPW